MEGKALSEFSPEVGTAGSEPISTGRQARLRKLLLLLGPAIVIAVMLYFYLASGRYISTDNAQLQAGRVEVAASVSGKVTSVEVSENETVAAGQVLFRVNPETFQIAVAEAQARLAAAKVDISSMRATYRQTRAELNAAQAQVTFAEAEVARQESLIKKNMASQAQYDVAKLALNIARESVQAAQAKSESVQASLGGDISLPIEDHPTVQRERAALAQARVALADAVVRAPQNGIVTRVHQLQVGDYVSASRPVFTLISDKVWVEANFKENQLQKLREGQPATVTLDAFPGQELRARITSFSPGTGNTFSLLPAENATGNWVKVVQRLAVQLALEEMPADLRLHAGLSAEVTVDTGEEMVGELGPVRQAEASAAPGQ